MIVIHVDFKDDEIIEVVAGRKSLWGDDEEFQILHFDVLFTYGISF